MSNTSASSNQNKVIPRWNIVLRLSPVILLFALIYLLTGLQGQGRELFKYSMERFLNINILTSFLYTFFLLMTFIIDAVVLYFLLRFTQHLDDVTVRLAQNKRFEQWVVFLLAISPGLFYGLFGLTIELHFTLILFLVTFVLISVYYLFPFLKWVDRLLLSAFEVFYLTPAQFSKDFLLKFKTRFYNQFILKSFWAFPAVKKIILLYIPFAIVFILAISIAVVHIGGKDILLINVDPAVYMLDLLTDLIKFILIVYLLERFIRKFFGVLGAVILLMVLALFFFSPFNNNHQLNNLEEPAGQLQTIDQRFSGWMDQQFPSADSLSTPDSCYLFIIASEGGGIRAAYWTSGFLAKVQNDRPDFMESTFAISSVSGGSLGAMLSLSLYRDRSQQDYTMSLQEQLDSFYSTDFVSPLLLGLNQPYALQRIIPYPFRAFDRAGLLEYSWSNTYQEVTQQPSFEQGLLQFYEPAEGPYLPSIFLNCTRVEDGKRAILSNLALDHPQFGDAYSILDTIGKDVPLKSAVLSSARFPLVTPAAKIVNRRNEYWGNIVDGGYYDNSGLYTALDILKIIYSETHSPGQDSAGHPIVKPVIVYLRNSMDVPARPRRFLHELAAPVDAFFNSWTAKTNAMISDLNELKGKYGFELLVFQLNRDKYKENIPLGWTLSRSTKQKINALIDGIGQPPDTGDRIDRTNFENYTRLMRYLEFNRQSRQSAH